MRRRRRADVPSVLLCAALLGGGVSAGCVGTTTRTSPRASRQQDVGNVVDRQTAGAGSKAGHGSRAPRGGALVTLPDVPEGAIAHRSGVTFPEQVGSFRRVRAYRADDGSAASAEYLDAGSRVRVFVSVGGRAGMSAGARYNAVRDELDRAGRGLLPEIEEDADDAVLSGVAESADDAARHSVRSYRVEVIGPDFLEYRATYPVARRQEGASAFERFRTGHAALMARTTG